MFAPNSHLRSQVTPAGRGKRTPDEIKTPAPQRYAAMSWAQRLKRVYGIDIETCEQCGDVGILYTSRFSANPLIVMEVTVELLQVLGELIAFLKTEDKSVDIFCTE